MDYFLSILGPLAEGAGVTLQVFFITLVLALPLGLVLALLRLLHRHSLKNPGSPSDLVVAGLAGYFLPIALARLFNSLWLRRYAAISHLVNAYIWLMRGTPLMLQMLFIYFALPFVPVIGVRLPDFPAAIIAFTLNYAAYFAEIFRGGIQSIDRGQYEAAKALGLSYGQTMRRIVLPQVVKRILAPVSNETITLVKDTSLIYILAMNDLMRTASSIVQRDFTTSPFLVAAVFYLLMTLVLTLGFQHLEKKYAVYDE